MTTSQSNVIELAKTLAMCKERVRVFGMHNLPRNAEAAARSGALMELARTALVKAQSDYDDAIARLYVAEINEIASGI